MDQTVLFAAALGIEEPIYIKAIRFDKEAGELHIDMDFRQKAYLACSVCGAEGHIWTALTYASLYSPPTRNSGEPLNKKETSARLR